MQTSNQENEQIIQEKLKECIQTGKPPYQWNDLPFPK